MLRCGEEVLVNTNKSKMMLGGEERLICKVLTDGTRFEQVSEFKYLCGEGGGVNGNYIYK